MSIGIDFEPQVRKSYTYYFINGRGIYCQNIASINRKLSYKDMSQTTSKLLSRYFT